MNRSSVARAPGMHRPSGFAERVLPASDWRLQAAIVFGLELVHLSFESVRTDHALILAGPLESSLDRHRTKSRPDAVIAAPPEAELAGRLAPTS